MEFNTSHFEEIASGQWCEECQHHSIRELKHTMMHSATGVQEMGHAFVCRECPNRWYEFRGQILPFPGSGGDG